MKTLKIAVLPVILLLLLTLGGCVTMGPETTVTGFQKTTSFEPKKVTLSFPVVVEKDMKTKKNPDATEKAVAGVVYASLKENLNRKGLLADQDNTSFNLDLRVHHYIATFFGWISEGGAAKGEPQGLIVRLTLSRKNGPAVAQIDSMDGTGAMRDYRNITTSVSDDLANQIEKILKEGVSVGKSP